MQNEDLNYYSSTRIKFSDKELEAIKKKTHKMLNKGRIIKVEKNYFWLYLGLLIFGFMLVIPYIFISTFCRVAEKILSTTMSIGAGIIGAVILAYLIELSNEVIADKEKINNYNCSIQNIHITLWQIFMCKPLTIFKDNLPDIKPFVDRQATLYISYYEMAIRQIDTHIEQFGNLMDEKVCDDLFIVKEQLVKFISDIKNPIESDYFSSLDGPKDWLREHCSQEWLKCQWLIY